MAIRFTREMAERYRELIHKAAISLPDEEALEVPRLFPTWAPDVDYTVDERVQYEGILYKVLQTHRSQADWNPINTPSLFARVLIPDPDVIPDWVQPDSTNPYMIGDKVRHNDKIWICTIDNNVWEPGVYGWEETTE
jgi:hypothetical protein